MSKESGPTPEMKKPRSGQASGLLDSNAINYQEENVMSKNITAAAGVTPATVDFHGHALTVITGPAGEQLVAMKPICEAIGLDWDGQRQRIKRHKVLSRGAVMITAPSASGDQEHTCLPLKMLNGWLFSVDAARVRPEIRDTLIQYQSECFDVLAAYWQQGEAVNPRKTRRKALPNGLTLEQQDAIKSLVHGRVEALPMAKRKGAAIRCWSALKSKFGVTYKEIDPAQFTDAVSLVARIELEGEFIGREEPKPERLAIDYPLSWWDNRKPGQPHHSLDLAAADLPLGEDSPCLRVLDTLHAAGYAIDAAFYELRTYQNLAHRWQGTIASAIQCAESLARFARLDLTTPQRYSVDR